MKNIVYLFSLAFFLSLSQPGFTAITIKTRILSNQAGTPEKEESLNVQVLPYRKNGLFNENHPVKYKLKVTNNYNSRQEGKIDITIKNEFGEFIGNSETEFSIASNHTKKISWDIPVENPGFYDIIVTINLTDYDDTIRNVFGYKASEINTPVHKPADFDAFWQKAKDELSTVAPDYTISPDEILSTPTHQVYYVEMKSLENVKINGWLTVPRPKGKYPVMFGLGGYRIEMKPLYFDDFAHFTINARGNGESNQIINPDNQELMTLHLEDKNKYVYRGIYMDCLRGLEFILSHEDLGLDTKRIGLMGGSQGGTLTWALAALSKKALFCIVDNPILCDAHTFYYICQNKRQPEGGFIIKFLKEFLRKNPNITKDKMLSNLSYFEIQNFIGDINCPTLLGLGLLDLTAPPTCAYAAFNRMPEVLKKKSSVFVFPNLAHEVSPEHNNFKSIWLYEHSIHPFGPK